MTRRKPEQVVKLLRKADEELAKGKSEGFRPNGIGQTLRVNRKTGLLFNLPQ